MTEGALFTIRTAYTLSQYHDYNRTVQKMNGVMRRFYITGCGYIAVGAVMSFLFRSWLFLPLFAALGAIYMVQTKKGLKRAEMDQYQREQLTGTITYTFYDDHVTVESSYGLTDNPYSAITRVVETDASFLLMLSPTSGMILPKEDCSAEMEYFIRTRFEITMML